MHNRDKFVEVTVRLPADLHTEIATECYCCGNPSKAAISRFVSLLLYHAWKDIEMAHHNPYWLSPTFDEIEDL